LGKFQGLREKKVERLQNFNRIVNDDISTSKTTFWWRRPDIYLWGGLRVGVM